MMSGGSFDEALGQVYKYHFDYTDLTAFEVSAKQVIPFWTWQRRALPLLIESVGSQPEGVEPHQQLQGRDGVALSRRGAGA